MCCRPIPGSRVSLTRPIPLAAQHCHQLLHSQPRPLRMDHATTVGAQKTKVNLAFLSAWSGCALGSVLLF
jgi:hypothetical protein